jgi:beta-lactamase superfamily II metal-dependent hydrolase
MFALEALEAKKGDALLLHYGKKNKPKLIVIDAGPSGVYNKTVKPRLEAIKQERSPNDPLPIRMVMVSHLDDDHINGIVQMFRQLEALHSKHKPLPFEILTLWHNAFNDLLGDDEQELAASLKPAIAAASKATFSPSLPVRRDTALVLASVNQGRELRDLAARLRLKVNEGFRNLVMVPQGKPSVKYDLGDGLTFTVIGPHEERVRALQEEWDKQIKQKGVARAAEFADTSVFNLSSITVLAACDKKTMLLTGDARGDFIVQGLKRAGLLKSGKIHVDLLKMPHHGSDNNVDTDFFRTVTADHYVISGNGEHHNPEIATLQMLSEARGNDKFTLYLTNEEKRLTRFFEDEKKRGKKYKVVFRKPKELGVLVSLTT